MAGIPPKPSSELLERVVATLGLEHGGDHRRGETCTGTLMVMISAFRPSTARRSTPSSTLAQRIAGARAEHGRRIVVDAEGYRERREAILCRQADRAAEEALRSGRPVALDAMTAGERRLVHEYLREHGAVQTYSEGDEPDRHLVVAPLAP